MFAMTSFGAKVDDSVNRGRGPYVFKISGQIYHWIGSLCPEEGNHPRFLQLYIYDTKDEVTNIISNFHGVNENTLNPEIVEGLIHVLDEHNGLVRLFRTARDRCNAGEIPGMKIRLYNKGGVRGYELPTTDTLGAIVFEDGPKSRTDFDVIIEFRGGPPQRISKLHQSYMSLQFPLLFTFGQPGFYPELVLKPRDGRGKGNKVTMNAYYNRLDYIRKNQANLRSDYLLGLYDVVSRGDREGIEVGSMIMLPSTFIGGPRYMYNHYLDALAIYRSLGNPQFFITFTSNVKWPEIKRYMLQYPGLTPSDRADIVCRIFQQKVNDFLRFLKDVRPLAMSLQFQKRGLPHCHTLLWVDSKTKIQSATQIDEYISAEIPDPTEDPTGYKVVTELMMHGPCGSANLGVACMQNGPCNKNFPKKFNQNTFIDTNGHTQYRRRDTGVYFMKGEARLDNSNVVPYNRALCLAFHAHINVEYCGWSMLIKYLFKYISKGPDRILAKINRPIGEASTSTAAKTKPIDEIQNYVDVRYYVHLENKQHVNFRNRDRLDVIVNLPDKKKTTLTECWHRRVVKTKKSLGRLAYVHPSSGDLFYFRLLLSHQKGCKSPVEVRTVNEQIYPTYRAAFEALGLFGDDREWDIALEESAISATSSEIRTLFAQLLIYCEVSDPPKLWRKHWQAMRDDIPAKVSEATGIPNYNVNTAQLQYYILYELEGILNGFGKYVKEFGLSSPPEKVYDLIINASKDGRQELLFVYGHGGTGKTFLWKTVISTLRSQGKIVLAVASSGIASLLLPAGLTAHSRFKLPLDLTLATMSLLGTPSHDVLETVAATIVSTIPHKKPEAQSAKKETPTAATIAEPRATHAKRSLDTELSLEAKKRRETEESCSDGSHCNYYI
ncbi:DNA helicase [Tanacetum coccineum]